jgi:uncharacterized protein (TIGR03435 family)
MVGWCAVALVLAFATRRPAGAQTQTPSVGPLAFEAASIKPNVSGSGGSSTHSSNGLLRITNQTLRSMIGYAYNVRDFQISGGPGWIASERYDVTAKPETGAHDQQMKQMLQTLLAERFQLQFHREIREGPIYVLLVGKDGPKLHPAKASDESGIQSGRDADTGRWTLRTTGGDSMERLAASLAARLERPVVDKTGLTGKFDFELSWIPDLTASTAGAANGALPEASGPSIFTAVQEQLGLHLESQRGPVEILIIDHAVKAAEN